MNPDTRDNWRKVKVALEAAGKTQCHLYLRACVVVRTGRDPGHPLGTASRSPTGET